MNNSDRKKKAEKLARTRTENFSAFCDREGYDNAILIIFEEPNVIADHPHVGGMMSAKDVASDAVLAPLLQDLGSLATRFNFEKRLEEYKKQPPEASDVLESEFLTDTSDSPENEPREAGNEPDDVDIKPILEGRIVEGELQPREGKLKTGIREVKVDGKTYHIRNHEVSGDERLAENSQPLVDELAETLAATLTRYAGVHGVTLFFQEDTSCIVAQMSRNQSFAKFFDGMGNALVREAERYLRKAVQDEENS